MTDRPLVVTGPVLARWLATNERTVRRLAANGVLPRVGLGSRAGFDPAVCVPAYVRYLRDGAGDSADLATARLKLTEAQRRAIELTTRQRERKVVEIDAVASLLEAVMATVGSQLDGLAGRMCVELAGIDEPAVVRQRLFDECRRIRSAAADQLETLADDSPGGQGTTGTAAEDG